jgi:hypothetical protein
MQFCHKCLSGCLRSVHGFTFHSAVPPNRFLKLRSNTGRLLKPSDVLIYVPGQIWGDTRAFVRGSEQELKRAA